MNNDFSIVISDNAKAITSELKDYNFTISKAPKKDKDKRNYGKVFRLAKKEKADLIITKIDGYYRVASKFKRRYKLLSNLELTILLQDDLFNNNKKYKFKFEKLTSHIFKYLKNKHTKNKTIIEVSNNHYILSNKKIIKLIIEMEKSYLENKETFYGRLNQLFKEYGPHRQNYFSEKIHKGQYKEFIKAVKGIKINTFSKTLKKKTVSEDKTHTVLDFEDGTRVIFDYKKELRTNIELVGQANTEMMDHIYFEREVLDWVKESSEVFEDKKWSWKAFFKYLLFTSLIVGTFIFVFLVIYKDSHKNGNFINMYTIVGRIFHSTYAWVWITPFLWGLVSRGITSWKMKRMFMMQGEKVSMKHLYVSNMMSSIISFVTPFAIGGDAIGYWYLRRKGFKRGKIIAVMFTDTLLYQGQFVLQTLILFSIGIPIYRDIFTSGDIQAHAALIWFIIGVAWTIFATIMIFTLTLSKRFQEFIVRNTARLLEWTRFFTLVDPDGLSAIYQYEFKQMRIGMKTLWIKWWFILEMLFYTLSTLFINVPEIIMYATGWIPENISGVNGYIASLVMNDIVGTANSMSITPGGAGTGEWLSIITKQKLYHDPQFSSMSIASAFDFLSKVAWGWPGLILSTAVLFAVVFRESHKDSKRRRRLFRKHSKKYALKKS